MSCCFATNTAGVQTPAPDPGLHVNYVRGLLLDVDDFRQEHAYLAGRDQWLVRDALGYGTLRGLAVGVSDTGTDHDDPGRWKVTVSAGSAADPCGRLVCVPRAQCGGLNAWLQAHDDAVTKQLAGGTQLALHVVLSYAECLTNSVPIPGEPCRSEDALKAPSRVADDFLLDFSLDAPAQAEEEGLRNFAQWLRNIPLAAGGGPSTVTREAFMALVKAWQPADTQPPPGLALAAGDVADYLRDALRAWATLLRPSVYGRACGCGLAELPAAAPAAPHEGRVLLATLVFEAEKSLDKGTWRAKALPAIDERRRPVLAHARLLAECLARAGAASVQVQPLARTGPSVQLVAAGKVAGDGSADGPVFGGLKAVTTGVGTVTFNFDGYAVPAGQHQYVVKVLAVSTTKDPAPVVRFLEYTPAGFVLRVNPGARAGSAKAAMEEHAFVLQVDEIRA